jgi:plastocyanin
MLTVGGVLAVLITLPASRSRPGRERDSRLPKLAAALALAVAAAVAGSFAIASAIGDNAAAGSTALVMEDFAFGPERVTAAGGRVSLHATNNDTAHHTFTLNELGVDVVVPPGQSRLITFDARPGRYDFYCKPHTPGMEGELIVAQF